MEEDHRLWRPLKRPAERGRHCLGWNTGYPILDYITTDSLVLLNIFSHYTKLTNIILILVESADQMLCTDRSGIVHIRKSSKKESINSWLLILSNTILPQRDTKEIHFWCLSAGTEALWSLHRHEGESGGRLQCVWLCGKVCLADVCIVPPLLHPQVTLILKKDKSLFVLWFLLFLSPLLFYFLLV